MGLVNQVTALLLAVMLSAVLSPSALSQTASPERLDEVTQRGRQVMPFQLEKSQHVFTKTESGGVQQVMVRSPSDTEQIELIRQHLRSIAEQFARGDFSGPASIHGPDMPGLAELQRAKSGSLRVAYKDLKDGGEITYVSEDPALILAIHRWFDAQLADHGPDAVPGHPGGLLQDGQDRHQMHHP